jgi:hypothetical protein
MDEYDTFTVPPYQEEFVVPPEQEEFDAEEMD